MAQVRRGLRARARRHAARHGDRRGSRLSVGAYPAVSADALPWVSVQEMRAVDCAAIDVGLSLERMMENAGASLAAATTRLLGGDVRGRRVVVLAGPGGNGGGGLVAARRLLGWGADVETRLADVDEEFAPVPREQLAILRRSGGAVVVGPGPLDDAELVVDAILGYSQRGAPRDAVGALWLADISIPSAVYERVGIAYRSPFTRGPIVALAW